MSKKEKQDNQKNLSEEEIKAVSEPTQGQEEGLDEFNIDQALDEAFSEYKETTGLTDQQEKKATDTERKDLTKIDKQAETAKKEAISQTEELIEQNNKDEKVEQLGELAEKFDDLLKTENFKEAQELIDDYKTNQPTEDEEDFGAIMQKVEQDYKKEKEEEEKKKKKPTAASKKPPKQPISQTKKEEPKTQPPSSELPKECETFFNDLKLGDLKSTKALHAKFETIFTDDIMKEIKIDPSLKQETATRYFNDLLQQTEQNLQLAIVDIEKTKKHHKELKNAAHGIWGGGFYAAAHKGVMYASRGALTVSATTALPIKMFVGGVGGGITGAAVSGFNYGFGHGYEKLTGKNIQRLAKKLEKILNEQGAEAKESAEQNFKNSLKNDLACLIDFDKKGQNKLADYSEELKNLKDEELANIFSGQEDEKIRKKIQLAKLIELTQNVKNLPKKKQKEAIEHRQKLIIGLINNNTLNEFVAYQIAEQIKILKKDGQPVELDPQAEQELIKQAALTVERDMNSILGDAIVQEKFTEIDKKGKSAFKQSYIGKLFDETPPQTFAQSLMKGLTSGAIAGIAFSDATAGSLYMAMQHMRGALREGIIKHSQDASNIKTADQIEGEISFAAQSDEDIKKRISQIDGPHRGMNVKDFQKLKAEKKELEKVLNLKPEEIKNIIHEARARIKLPDINAVNRAKIENQITKLENKLILQAQLEEPAEENNQDISNFAQGIISGRQKEINQAADLAEQERKATSIMGLTKRFLKIKKGKGRILGKTVIEGAKAAAFAAIGHEIVNMGGKAYAGERINLKESAVNTANQATFGLAGYAVGKFDSKANKAIEQNAANERIDQEFNRKIEEIANKRSQDFMEALDGKTELLKHIDKADGASGNLSVQDKKAFLENSAKFENEFREIINQKSYELGEKYKQKHSKVLSQFTDAELQAGAEKILDQKIGEFNNRKGIGSQDSKQFLELDNNATKDIVNQIKKDIKATYEMVEQMDKDSAPAFLKEKVEVIKNQEAPTSKQEPQQKIEKQISTPPEAPKSEITEVEIKGKVDSVWDAGKEIRKQLADEIKLENPQELKGQELKDFKKAQETYINDAIKDEILVQRKGKVLVREGEVLEVDMAKVREKLIDKGFVEKANNLDASEVKNILENDAKIEKMVKNAKAENVRVTEEMIKEVTTGKAVEEVLPKQSKVQTEKIPTENVKLNLEDIEKKYVDEIESIARKFTPEEIKLGAVEKLEAKINTLDGDPNKATPKDWISFLSQSEAERKVFADSLNNTIAQRKILQKTLNVSPETIAGLKEIKTIGETSVLVPKNTPGVEIHIKNGEVENVLRLGVKYHEVEGSEIKNFQKFFHEKSNIDWNSFVDYLNVKEEIGTKNMTYLRNASDYNMVETLLDKGIYPALSGGKTKFGECLQLLNTRSDLNSTEKGIWAKFILQPDNIDNVKNFIDHSSFGVSGGENLKVKLKGDIINVTGVEVDGRPFKLQFDRKTGEYVDSYLLKKYRFKSGSEFAEHLKRGIRHFRYAKNKSMR